MEDRASPKTHLGCSQYIGLTDLPQEILLIIFSRLSLGSGVLLGLICKRLYITYKSVYPYTKVSLLEPCSKSARSREIRLADLLETWIGPRYRRHDWSYERRYYREKIAPPQYLLRKLYGDFPGYSYDTDPPPSEVTRKEHFLSERYCDYHHYFRTNSQTGERDHILPNPFNAGDEWFLDAKRAVIADAVMRRSWEEWMVAWSDRFVFRNRFYKIITYGDKLKVLQDLQAMGREGWCEKGGVGNFKGWVRRWRRRWHRSRHLGNPFIDMKPYPPSRELSMEYFQRG
ncbi:hypothetical protein N431DRAFT_486403 [Stipitochalara longipes BDJ]|nr:hypothetical protein N431DRAFT_486403 [Stipitochalara longipes BDJ]